MEAPRTGATTMASPQRRLAAGASPERSFVPVAAALTHPTATSKPP